MRRGPFDSDRRSHLCLACRTVLSADEPCDVDTVHRVVALIDPREREVLVEQVWGPPSERVAARRRALQGEQMVAAASMGSVVAAVWGAWVVVGGVGLSHILGAAVAGGAAWAGGNRLLGRRDNVYPRGATPLDLPPAAGEMRRGEVGGISDLIAPATATDCIGFSLELVFEGYWGERVMFRDAVTSGFEVQLEGGGMAHVPTGRMRLFGPMVQEIDVDNRELDAYMRPLDPFRAPGSAFDPLHYNVVYETVLVPGDRVELVSRFEPVPCASVGPGLYRDAAPSVLVPVGVPVLRLLRGAR